MRALAIADNLLNLGASEAISPTMAYALVDHPNSRCAAFTRRVKACLRGACHQGLREQMPVSEP